MIIVQVHVSFTGHRWYRHSRSWRLVNAFKTRPGIVYIAILVMLVVSIPMLREAKHMRSLQGWPTGASQPHRSFSG
ncbi:hypothetical protein [Neorhizobium sp. JUb45]|uniref:hypothetical protein n=1 Tax=unclassified Neorhizobium TaxID=2629175 RepID=UPI00104E677F|nr:hypothetical protein [Neorhizobium sp. JUb45]